MNRHYSSKQNTVKVCKRDTCVEAKGKHADQIAGAAVVMLLCLGFAAVISAAR